MQRKHVVLHSFLLAKRPFIKTVTKRHSVVAKVLFFWHLYQIKSTVCNLCRKRYWNSLTIHTALVPVSFVFATHYKMYYYYYSNDALTTMRHSCIIRGSLCSAFLRVLQIRCSFLFENIRNDKWNIFCKKFITCSSEVSF